MVHLAVIIILFNSNLTIIYYNLKIATIQVGNPKLIAFRLFGKKIRLLTGAWLILSL